MTELDYLEAAGISAHAVAAASMIAPAIADPALAGISSIETRLAVLEIRIEAIEDRLISIAKAWRE